MPNPPASHCFPVVRFMLTLVLGWTAIMNADAAEWDLRKLATGVEASSSEGNFKPEYAADAVPATRWSSDFSDPQWIAIDLGESRPVSRIILNWEAAFAKKFRLEISDDGKNWKTLEQIQDGKGGTVGYSFKNVNARFVRMFGEQRATRFGYSLHEFEVYGPHHGKEPAFAGLIKPRPKNTLYQSDKTELDKRFARELAKDPPDSHKMSDDQLLDLIQRRTFDCFWYEANPETYFMPDSTGWQTHASVAGIGYQLAAYVIGHSRKYRDPDEIYQRVEALLDHCYDDPYDPEDIGIENHSGHPYHWVNIHTGQWEGHEGVCTHDTTTYLCGVIVAKNYFEGTKAADIAEKILKQVDWHWLEHGVKNRRFLSNMYAKTDKDHTGPGDVRYYDGPKFNYLLAMGWPENNVEPRYWDNWAMDYPWDHYLDGYWRIQRPALWCHQWDSVWFDFRQWKDDYADYHQNSIEAALANRQWCIDHQSYSANLWGLNPCAGPGKYGNYGAPPDDLPFQNGSDNDGTVTPTAALPCIIWTPEESIQVARTLYDKYKSKIWTKYGFTDSLNPKKNWYSKDTIAIDQGPIIINLENHRTGLIQRLFEKEPAVWNGLERAGFVGIIDDFDPSEHSPAYATWKATGCELASDTQQARQGTRSLKLVRKGRTAVTLAAKPERTDFSRFRTLSFWTKDGSRQPPEVTLVSAEDNEINLDHLKAEPSFEGWVRQEYALPQSTEETQAVREVRFRFDSMPGDTAWMDDVVLHFDQLKSPDKRLIADFEKHNLHDAHSDWSAGKNAKLGFEKFLGAEGGETLSVGFQKPGEPATVEIKPAIKDWRKVHSLTLRARGSAGIKAEVVDESGRKAPLKPMESGKDWSRFYFNVQANFYPNTLNLMFDKEAVAKIVLTITPTDSTVREIHLDSVYLTD